MTTNRCTPWAMWVVVWVIGLGLGGFGGGGVVVAQNFSIGPNITPDAMVADQLVILSQQTLRGESEPRDNQWVRSRILLDQALKFDPANAEVWRLRAEMAKLTDDEAGYLQALDRYLQLRPGDDAAYLTLIENKLANFQLAEQRLGAVKRLLSDRATGRFSSAVRSRLMSMGAALCREMGDDKQFRKLLADAIKTDGTNNEAAQLMYEFVTSSEQSPLVVGAAVMRVVRARPFDPGARRMLGRLMLQLGAYDAAATQFEVARLAGESLEDVKFCFDWAFAQAASGRSDEALALLDEYLAGVSQRVTAQWRKMFSAKLAEARDAGLAEPQQQDFPPPDGPQLPLELQLMRLALLHQREFDAKADGVFGRLRELLDEQIKQGDKQAATDVTWLALLFNRAGDEREGWLKQLAVNLKVDDPVMQRLRGFDALHRRRISFANDMFDRLKQTDAFGWYGLSLITPADDLSLKVERLNQTVAGARASLAGMLAAMTLHDLEQPVAPTDAGAGLLALYDQWPGSLRSPKPQQLPWATMNVNLVATRFDYLDPFAATIELRNTSEIPVSLGSGGSLPTNVMVFVIANVGGKRIDLAPTVVNLDRRIVLEPNESVRVEARLDRGALGAMLTSNATERVWLQLTAFLDPRPSSDGTIKNGPLGSSMRVRSLERRGLAVSTFNVDEWIKALDDPDPTQRLVAVARLMRVSLQFGDEEDSPMKSTGDKVIGVLNTKFPEMSVLEQAWAVRFLPSGEKSVARLRRVHDLAQRSDDPLTRIFYLMTQVTSVSSPQLDAALRHGDPLVGEFAKAYQTALELAVVE